LFYSFTRFRTTIIKPYHQELLLEQEQNESPKAVQEKEPQPRDPDTIVVDIPNIFYFQQEYNNLDKHEDYNSNPITTFILSKEELDL
jgi:hypothetical protein